MTANDKAPGIEFWIGYNPKSFISSSVHGAVTYFRGHSEIVYCKTCKDPLITAWEKDRIECYKCIYPNAYNMRPVKHPITPIPPVQVSFQDRYPQLSEYRATHATTFVCETCDNRLMKWELTRGQCSLCVVDITIPSTLTRTKPKESEVVVWPQSESKDQPEQKVKEIRPDSPQVETVLTHCPECSRELEGFEVAEGFCLPCLDKGKDQKRAEALARTQCSRCFIVMRSEQEIKDTLCSYCSQGKMRACRKCGAVLLDIEIELQECIPDCAYPKRKEENERKDQS